MCIRDSIVTGLRSTLLTSNNFLLVFNVWHTVLASSIFYKSINLCCYKIFSYKVWPVTKCSVTICLNSWSSWSEVLWVLNKMFNVNTRGPVYWVDVDWRVIIKTFPPVLLCWRTHGTMMNSVPWVLQIVLRLWWISSECRSGQMWVLRCSVGWVFLGLTASGSILLHCSVDSDRCWCYYRCFPFLPAGARCV